MPTYDYRCKLCEHTFEHFQSMNSRVLRKCPKCDEKGLERLIGTGGGLIFKGSGFYITDYRSDSYEKSKKKDSPGGGDSDKKAETKSESSSSTKDSGKSKPKGADQKSDGSSGS